MLFLSDHSFQNYLPTSRRVLTPFSPNPTKKMLSNASAIAAVFANSRVRVTPMTGDEGHSKGPLAGQDHSTQQHLVERMEAEGDDWAIWQGKPLALTYAPTFRPRTRRVRRHPVVVAARLAARLALNAARAADSRAAASATRAALKHGLIAAPRQVIPNAIRWGPQVAGRAGVNQATRTIGRAARRGARRVCCHTRQGDRKCGVKVASGSDADGGGGETTMGARGDGMEVVHRPTV
jgi:hypothetical protein